MTASTIASQDFEQPQLIHPRGFARSAVFTCSHCGYLVDKVGLHRVNNCATCANCHATYIVGLHLYRIPRGFHLSRYHAPDAQVPGYAEGLIAIRTRSREKRIATLSRYGLADGMLPVPLSRAVRGAPINRLEIVSEPTTSSDSEQSSSSK